MTSSSKTSSKRRKHSSSISTSKISRSYVLLRDQGTEKLRVVPQKEIISAKDLAKLGIGDIVCHGKRDKRIRGEIVLLGKTLIIFNK
jgi:hypothetical protein